MPSNNHRQGKTRRSAHLKEAPAPSERRETLPPEDEPWTLATQTTVTLTQDEYIRLRDQAEDRAIADAPGSVPTPSHTDDYHRAELSDQEGDIHAVGSSTPAAAEQPPLAGVANAQQAELDSSSLTSSDEVPLEKHPDPDPHFDELANASARPPRACGLPGSAAIEAAPIRAARRRATSRSEHAERHTAAPRFRRRRIILPAALVLLVLIIAFTLERPSTSITTSSASRHQAGLIAVGQLLAPLTQDIALIAKDTALHGSAAHSARPSSRLRHTQHRAPRRRRTVARAKRAPITAAHTTQAAPTAAGGSSNTSSTHSQSSSNSTSAYSPPPAITEPAPPPTKSAPQPAGPSGPGGTVGTNCNPKCS